MPNDITPSATVVLNSEQRLYRKKLHERLNQTDDFEGFKALISKELDSYGISNWSYAPLDLPDQLTAAEPIGTIERGVVDCYLERSLYENDMVLQHVNVSDKPIFQSDIEWHINQSPVASSHIVCHSKIIKLNKQFGHEDVCAIPVTSSVDGGRFLFSLTSHGGEARRFKPYLSTHLLNLKTLAMTVNDIGVRKYPDNFLSAIKKYRTIVHSQPLNLLATIAKYDLSISEGAARLGITESTASKHLKTIRELLQTKTNYGAYRIAQKRGYIAYDDH